MTTDQAVTTARARASAAVQRASQVLLARQDSQGWWSGSASDVTLEAEALLAAEALGIRTAETTSAAAQQIRSLQQADGRWMGSGESAAEGDGPAAAGDLSASVLAYLALRLAGDSADAYHMAVAAGWIRDTGGIAAAGVLARTWLALFGLTEWSDVPVPGLEVCYLPGRYAASRPAAVALAIIGTLRPVRPLPINVGELWADDMSALAATEHRPRRRVPAPTAARAAALRRCGQLLISWQHRSGLPAGRRPTWPCSLVALHLLGYPLDHPVLAKGLSWLAGATAQPRQATRSSRPAALHQPPVLETTLAVEALAASGLPPDHAALVTAGRWLLLQRIEGPAVGPGVAAGPEPSGWSFGRDGYPVVVDTARVLLALSRIKLPGLTGKPAIGNAIRWLTGMQGRDGSWNGSATATSHAVLALAIQGGSQPRAIRRGVVWLLRHQRPDGAWAGQEGVSDLLTTASVLPALVVAGVLAAKPPIRSAIGWLLRQQNSDGGWTTAAQPAAHRAASQAQATARAMAALLVAGGAGAGGAEAGGAEAGGIKTSAAIDLAADWLVRAQQPDGGWRDEMMHGHRTHGAARSGRDPGRADRGGADDPPHGRATPRRRSALVPGLLLPLYALGRYVAADRAEGGDADHVDGRRPARSPGGVPSTSSSLSPGDATAAAD